MSVFAFLSFSSWRLGTIPTHFLYAAGDQLFGQEEEDARKYMVVTVVLPFVVGLCGNL